MPRPVTVRACRSRPPGPERLHRSGPGLCGWLFRQARSVSGRVDRYGYRAARGVLPGHRPPTHSPPAAVSHRRGPRRQSRPAPRQCQHSAGITRVGDLCEALQQLGDIPGRVALPDWGRIDPGQGVWDDASAATDFPSLHSVENFMITDVRACSTTDPAQPGHPSGIGRYPTTPKPGTGAAPRRWVRAASEWSRSGLSRPKKYSDSGSSTGNAPAY